MYKKLLFIFGLAGVLFSGYLTFYRYFTGVCALNEPCPFFLGYPACWYGLAMFLIIFITSGLLLFGFASNKIATKVLISVSLLGTLFAGYFTIPEMSLLFSGARTLYTLGLPSCAYGLIFYVLVLLLSIKQSKELN